ncbi:MAG: ABC transporter permease [bacterium]
MAGALGAYVGFAQAAFRREAAYRVSILIAMVGFATKVYVLQFVWTSLYRTVGDGAPGGITLAEMISYMIMGQLLSLLLRSNASDHIRTRVRDGLIAIDMMRPVSFPLSLLADDLGATALNTALVGPALGLALALGHLLPPPSPAQATAFGASVALAYLVQVQLFVLFSMTAFWTLETYGLNLAMQFAALLLSGVMVPLWFLPDSVLQVARLLPFASVYSTPLSIYIGRLQGPSVLDALALQAGWAAALALLVSATWARAARRLVIQGG